MNHWDQRYADRTDPGEPCEVLSNFKHLLPAQGCALDLACGLGANALLLAERGLDTHAWDNSSVALSKLQGFADARQLTVTNRLIDVDQHPPAASSFDVICVSYFLSRPLCPAMIEALKPGGLLFYQTFNQQRVSTSGPKNSDFLLRENELLSLFSPLTIRYYREEGIGGELEKGLRNLSYLVAEKSKS